MNDRPDNHRSILVCWDPGDERPAAAEWAARTARWSGDQLVVFSAFAKAREAMRPEDYRALRHSHKSAVEEFTDNLGSGMTCRVEFSNNDLRVELFDVAEEGDVRLIVVATSDSSSGPGLLHLGSVTEFLAHHTSIPLAVISDVSSGPERIAVFDDGADAGQAAVRWAAEHAGLSNANVTSLTAESGVTTMRQLVRAADENAVDLIVIGAPDVSPRLGRRLGGAALKLLHTTDRSVVIVPRRPDGDCD